MKTRKLIFFAFIVEMFCVAVCGAVSYGEAVGKPKKFSYREGSKVAEPSARTAKPITPAHSKDCNSQNNGESYCIANNLSESSFDTKDAAAWGVAQTIMKDRECRQNWESTYLIYEKAGKFYYGTPQFYSNQKYGKQHAPVDVDHKYVQSIKGNDYNVVAAIHPHPSGSWFSLADASTAKKLGIDCYLLPCRTATSINRYNWEQPNIYALDHHDGVVYPIIRERRGKGMIMAPGDYYGMEGMYQGIAQYRGLKSNRAANDMNENTERNVEKGIPVTNSGSIAAADNENLAGKVGVRGWCDCGAEHGKICFMGEGAYASDGTNIGGGDYIYKLCGKCAKLFKPSRSRNEAEIIDLRIERKYKKFVGTERMPTHKYLSLLKQAENKLLDIPDGEIVIHGVCTCKEPDPIVFSYASYAYVKAGKQNLAVCCSCGKEYVSADGSIPCGPTAKREMGLE